MLCSDFFYRAHFLYRLNAQHGSKMNTRECKEQCDVVGVFQAQLDTFWDKHYELEVCVYTFIYVYIYIYIYIYWGGGSGAFGS